MTGPAEARGPKPVQFQRTGDRAPRSPSRWVGQLVGRGEDWVSSSPGYLPLEGSF